MAIEAKLKIAKLDIVNPQYQFLEMISMLLCYANSNPLGKYHDQRSLA